MNGDTVLFENNFTTSVKTNNFCVPPIITSLDNLVANANFELFPNPILKSEILRIEFEEAFLFRIYNLKGQLVREGNKEMLLNRNIGLESGIYFISLNQLDGKRIGTKKLVVY